MALLGPDGDEVHARGTLHPSEAWGGSGVDNAAGLAPWSNERTGELRYLARGAIPDGAGWHRGVPAGRPLGHLAEKHLSAQFHDPALERAEAEQIAAEAADAMGLDMHSDGASVAPARVAPQSASKTEIEIEQALADGLRFKAMPHLSALARIKDEAKGHGLEINWGFGVQPSGRHVVAPISVVKHL